VATNRPTRTSKTGTTGKTGKTGKLLGYLESRKNLTGSACGVVGVTLTLAGVAGPYWPVVVAGLYGAGALLAPRNGPHSRTSRTHRPNWTNCGRISASCASI
jgi:hypothetical protein